MVDNNTNSSEKGSESNTRRNFIKKAGLTSIAVPAFSGTVLAQPSENQTEKYYIPKNSGYEKEVEVIGQNSFATVEEDEQEYIIIVDKQKVPEITKADRREAKKHRERVRQKLIDSQDQPSGSTLSASSSQVYSVNLGEDTVISEMTKGNSGAETSGFVPRIGGSSYDLSDNKVKAAIVAGPGGAGSSTQWGWVGTEFKTGSGSAQTANISFNGKYNGQLSAFFAGTGEVTIFYKLKNLDNGQEVAKDNIEREFVTSTFDFVTTKNVQDTFNIGPSVQLQPNTHYNIKVRMEATASIEVAGEAGSDFGDQDGDSSSGGEGQKMKVFDISFNF